MFKNTIIKYIGVTLVCFVLTYSMYYLTILTIGHSLLFFAVLQFFCFVLIMLHVERQREKSFQYLLTMVSGFLKGESNDYSNFINDDNVFLLTRKIKELRQHFEEDILVYKQAQTRFFHILQNIRSSVILLDRYGKILFINAAGEELFQLSRIEAISRTHWKIGRESGLSNKIEEVVRTGEAITTELKIEHPFSRLLETTISPTNLYGTGHQEIIILMHDITERGLMEQMRKEFVANVSHELKTPLTSIKGFTETLLDGAIENKEIAERFLRIIHKETDRLQEMVNSLLELSVIESKGIFKSDANINEIVEEAIEQLKIEALKKNIKIDYKSNSTTIHMLADGHRIKQVIINLLSNSVKYSLENKNILVLLTESSEDIQIMIKDQGIGIPVEHLDRVFERFYRVDTSRDHKSGGRGIGLSIVKQIVKQHGGQLLINSTVNVGTTITIIFKK